MIVSFLALLLITFIGTFSVFNCGANKRKKEEEAKARELERYRYREHVKLYKENWEPIWKSIQEYGSSCSYLEQFCECDLLKRLKGIYNDVRCNAYWRAFDYGDKIMHVGDWLKFDLELGQAFLPFFQKVVQEAKEKHKTHLDKKELDQLDDILKNVEADYEKVKEAQRKHDKEKKGKEIVCHIEDRRKFIKNKEGWMLPSYYDEYDEEKARPRLSKYTPSLWKQSDIEKVLGTCKKKLHGSKCDFIERGNFYVAAWRKHANIDIPDSLPYDEEQDGPYDPSDLIIVKFDVKLSDEYMKKLEKAKEEHKGLKDHLDANEIDKWFESHVEKTKELKKKLDELKEGKEDEKNKNWKKIIGYETFPDAVSLYL